MEHIKSDIKVVKPFIARYSVLEHQRGLGKSK